MSNSIKALISFFYASEPTRYRKIKHQKIVSENDVEINAEVKEKKYGMHLHREIVG